jgi:hypothetical protein
MVRPCPAPFVLDLTNDHADEIEMRAALDRPQIRGDLRRTPLQFDLVLQDPARLRRSGEQRPPGPIGSADMGQVAVIDSAVMRRP